jgi:N-methylhydantoinase B
MTATENLGAGIGHRLEAGLFEVLTGAFRALVEEADDLLERASMGMVIRESRDYCAVVCDADGNVLATGTKDLPAFVGNIQFTVQGVREQIGVQNFRPGDAYIVNDPWTGGTHFNDIRIVLPIFHGEELIGYTAAAGHVTDIGGPNPGSFNISASSCFAEGLRIVPVLFARGNVLNQDVLRLILGNIRVPELTEGDLRALLSAVQRADQRVGELVTRYGLDLVRQWMEEYQSWGVERALGVARSIRQGTFSFTDWIDEDPVTGEPKRIQLSVTISNDGFFFDFEGTDTQSLGAANAVMSTTIAVVWVVTCYVFPEIPPHYGAWSKMKVRAPDGSIVNAEFPAGVSAMASTAFDIIAACVFGCLAQVVPDRVIAASYNLQSFVTGGIDPRTGEEFVTYSWGPGGWGAGRDTDGRVAMALYTTTTMNIPCEAEERRVPFVIEEYAIVPDSGGAGRRRGGNCLRRVFRFGYDGYLTSLGGRGKFPIWGLFGGEAGSRQYAILESGGVQREIGMLADSIPIKRGDRLIYVNGGGGGYGPPIERERERVLEDVLDGWISVEAARDSYGVVLTEVLESPTSAGYVVDEASTAELRGRLLAES